jgi:aspartyl-tRNA(Asn)/glutamyl-tRNA(Gln) amidotransferase subunit B
MVEQMKQALPEAPGARIRRLEAEIGFDLAEGLVASGRDRLYERVDGERRIVANVIMNQLAGSGVDPGEVDPTELGRLIEARDRIPRTTFDQAIAHAGDAGFSAAPFLAEVAISDSGELDPVIDEILAANPGQVDAYRNGKEGLVGFFVGQVMKATGGKANPKIVNQRVREKLKA